MTTDTTKPAGGQTPVAEKPVPGTPEYDTYMAAEYDRRTTGPSHDDPTPATTEKVEEKKAEVTAIPEGGAEKFYNKETGEYNWQAHAKEAEYRLKNGKDKPEEKPEDKPADGEKKPDADAAAADVVTKAGLNVQTLRDQIVTSGKLDDAAVEALVTKGGVPKELVEDYVALAKYRIEAETSKAVDYAGGQEGWNSLNKFAAEAMAPEERAEVNRLLGSPSWKLGIDLIRNRQAASSKTAGEPTLRSGDSSAQPTANGYRSRAEMMRDMQDQRYRGHKKDPAFIRSVQDKLAVSTFDLDK